MNRTFGTFAVLCLVLAPAVCYACEPIVPMAMLYSGTTLLSVVAFKSAVGLLVAVAVKCAVFCWKSDLKTMRAILYMAAANAYSTVPGILLGITFAAPMIFLLQYPILLMPAGKMQNYPWFRRFGKYGSAGILFVLILASMFLFEAAMGTQDTSLTWYWVLKIVYSTIAVAISFLISVVCEDGIISYLSEKRFKEKRSFLEPVIWANAVVFIVVLGVGAAVALPRRLASPNFLIGVVKHIVEHLAVV